MERTAQVEAEQVQNVGSLRCCSVKGFPIGTTAGIDSKSEWPEPRRSTSPAQIRERGGAGCLPERVQNVGSSRFRVPNARFREFLRPACGDVEACKRPAAPSARTRIIRAAVAA